MSRATIPAGWRIVKRDNWFFGEHIANERTPISAGSADEVLAVIEDWESEREASKQATSAADGEIPLPDRMVFPNAYARALPYWAAGIDWTKRDDLSDIVWNEEDDEQQ